MGRCPVEEALEAGVGGGEDPGFHGDAAGEIIQAAGKLDVIVGAVEAGSAVGVAADAAGCVEGDAVGVGAVAMIGGGVESCGAGSFAEAVIKIGRIGQDQILIASADETSAGGALDADAGVIVKDGDVGGQVVDAGIDKDGVAEFQVVGFEDGADGGLGVAGVRPSLESSPEAVVYSSPAEVLSLT